MDMSNMSNIELHQVDVSQTMVKKTWDKTEQIVLLDYSLEVFSQDFRLQACPHIRLHRVTFFTLDSRALYLCHLCHPQKNSIFNAGKELSQMSPCTHGGLNECASIALCVCAIANARSRTLHQK